MTVEGYDDVLRRVGRAAARVGRDPTDISVVAVSKGTEISQIERLYEAGQRDFGENRAQELQAKARGLPADIRWHFVGPLQTNKVRGIRPITHVLHSMDRMRLADAWLKGRGQAPPVLVQVNLGDEPQKHGFGVDETHDRVGEMIAFGLDVIGVMAIPPRVSDPEMARSYFRQLRSIRDEIRADFPLVERLSMGMTEDFEVAIEEGATTIRVGRAIFKGPNANDG